MATITIASTVFPNVNYTGSVFTWRIFSDKSWVAQDGTIVPARGDSDTFFKEYTVSVSGTNGTVPQITLLSQTDAPNEKNALYSVYWCVDGVLKDMVLANTLGAFQVPDTPASTTWSALEQYNFGVSRRYYKDDNTYSALVIDQKIAAVTGTTNLATSTRAALPTAGTAGRQRLLTDSVERVMVDTGSLWWSPSGETFDVRRFGAVGDGATDDTTTVQAAITAAGGRGKVVFPRGSYIITNSLTIPQFSASGSQSFSMTTLEGEGGFLSNLINKASAGKPTLLINRDCVTVKGLGFWSAGASYPNDAIRIFLAGRIYIQDNTFYANGNGIRLQQAQSVWIQDNYGNVSAGSSLKPTGALLDYTLGATDAFIRPYIPTVDDYVHHLVIEDNMNEGYNYQIYTDNAGAAICFSWWINNNQFESAANGGILMDHVQNFEVNGNYFEGQQNVNAGYAVKLASCRNGRVGPNFINTVDAPDLDNKRSTIYLSDTISTTMLGNIPRLYLTGDARGNVAHGGLIDRIQDESTQKQLSLVDTFVASFTVPQGVLNASVGRATWYSDTIAIATYPTARLGDTIWKVTPATGQSPGWICTTASSAGALVPNGGNTGSDPTVLNDYPYPTAYDYRITVITGGVVGTATYKVEWKTAGGGVYADLTGTLTTSELAHLVLDQIGGGGPAVSFAIRWLIAPAVYVTGDKWTLTAVVAPTWKAMAVLA